MIERNGFTIRYDGGPLGMLSTSVTTTAELESVIHVSHELNLVVFSNSTEVSVNGAVKNIRMVRGIKEVVDIDVDKIRIII